jgi:hypothetical protein
MIRTQPISTSVMLVMTAIVLLAPPIVSLFAPQA